MTEAEVMGEKRWMKLTVAGVLLVWISGVVWYLKPPEGTHYSDTAMPAAAEVPVADTVQIKESKDGTRYTYSMIHFEGARVQCIEIKQALKFPPFTTCTVTSGAYKVTKGR